VTDDNDNTSDQSRLVITRAEAKARGLKRYFDKICIKHPELNGERVTASYVCVDCARIETAKWYERRRQERVANGEVIFGEACEKHPELKGARRANGRCVKCHREWIKQYRQRPEIKAYELAKQQDPKVRARRAEQDHIRYAAKRAAYEASPEYQAKLIAREQKQQQAKRQRRLKHVLKVRLRPTLRYRYGIKKSGSFLSLFGCSVAFLVQHIERQFQPGMSWDNRRLWHVDHIRPVSSFDLTDRTQRYACFHYSNLQPLWGADNISKGTKPMEEWLATRCNIVPATPV
jgi:hypothetical protein